MLHRTATSCISVLMSRDLAYLPIKVAIENGATLIFIKGPFMVFEELRRQAIYVVGSLEDYLNADYQIDFNRYHIAYFYDKELGEYFKKQYPETSPLMGFYVFNNFDNHIIDNGEVDFRVMSDADFDVVHQHYPYLSVEEAHETLQNKRIFGLYVEEKLVGFIGLHSDQTMGMLRIFEEYRRHGYGFALEAALNNYLVEHQRLVYCHVEETNEASLKLQHKLGFTQSNKKQYWLFNEK